MRNIFLLTAILLLISCKENKAELSTVRKDNRVENINRDTLSSKTADSGKEFNPTDEVFDNWLKIGISDDLITSKLGAERTVQNGEYSQADGYYHEEWHYPVKGIIFLMQWDEPGSDKKVGEITIKQLSDFKTSRGVGIGSSKDEVYKAYPDANQNDTADDVIVAGNIYDGLFFTITDDKVSEIFIGALAE